MIVAAFRSLLITTFLLTLQLTFASERSLLFKDQRMYKIPSEDSGFFLQQPVDAVMDNQGRLYVLDSGAKCIFVWDQNGKFITSLGKEGEGPGEFTFGDPARSEISFDGKHIIILDDMAKKWHTIENLQFKNMKQKENHLGRITYFECLKTGSILVWEQEYRTKVPYSVVYISDKDFSNKKILLEYEDTAYRRNDNNGWNINPGAKIPAIFADYFSEIIIIGDSVTPLVHIFDLKGKLIRDVPVTLGNLEFTDEDKQDFLATYKWLKPPHKLIRPEYKQLFNFVLPFRDKELMVLVSRFQPNKGFFEGIIYNENNDEYATFKHVFGELGGLSWSKNQLIAFYNDENGEYSIKAIRHLWTKKESE